MKTLTIINEVNNKFYSSLNEKEFNNMVLTIESACENYFTTQASDENYYNLNNIKELYLSIEPYLSTKVKEEPMQVKELIMNYNSIINTLTLSREVVKQQSTEMVIPDDVDFNDKIIRDKFLKSDNNFDWEDESYGEPLDDSDYEITKSFSLKVPKIDYYGFRFFDTPSDTTPLQVRG